MKISPWAVSVPIVLLIVAAFATLPSTEKQAPSNVGPAAKACGDRLVEESDIYGATVLQIFTDESDGSLGFWFRVEDRDGSSDDHAFCVWKGGAITHLTARDIIRIREQSHFSN